MWMMHVSYIANIQLLHKFHVRDYIAVLLVDYDIANTIYH